MLGYWADCKACKVGKMIKEKEVIEDFKSISLYLNEGVRLLDELRDEVSDFHYEKIFEVKSHFEAIKYFIGKYSEEQDGRA